VKKNISDADIKNINARILSGERVTDVTSELGISRQFYYEKAKSLDLLNKKDVLVERKKKDINELDEIKDMHDLANILDLSFEAVHKYVNPTKTAATNIKRMNYLKNHSPEKFNEAIIITILNYYKISPINLIKVLKK